MPRAVGWFVLFVLSAGEGGALLAQAQNGPEKRSISVIGTGHATADADLAIVRVGYKLYGPDGKTAYATAVETSNAIMQALTGSGVPKASIESTSQVLQHTAPYELGLYPTNSEERRLREFTVTQSWVIRVKPEDAAQALNTAVDAGANESGWIQWVVENPGRLQARAAAAALGEARDAAEQIAQRSGVRLTHLINASENQGPTAYGGAMAMASGNGIGALDTVTIGNQQLAINSRRVEFVITVYAEYAIE